MGRTLMDCTSSRPLPDPGCCEDCDDDVENDVLVLELVLTDTDSLGWVTSPKVV